MRTLLASIVLLGLMRPASAEVYEVGVGAGLLSFNSDGEAATQHSVGPTLDAGVGWQVSNDIFVFGRLLATSGIEDEQHAHDDVVLAATFRSIGGRVWGEGGLGVGFYRGRYRDQSFFSADSAYDGDYAAPTVLLGSGVNLHRDDTFAIDAHIDVSVSLFGGEVPFVAGVHAFIGARWKR
jgi:hypothetical protein